MHIWWCWPTLDTTIRLKTSTTKLPSCGKLHGGRFHCVAWASSFAAPQKHSVKHELGRVNWVMSEPKTHFKRWIGEHPNTLAVLSMSRDFDLHQGYQAFEHRVVQVHGRPEFDQPRSWIWDRGFPRITSLPTTSAGWKLAQLWFPELPGKIQHEISSQTQWRTVGEMQSPLSSFCPPSQEVSIISLKSVVFGVVFDI